MSLQVLLIGGLAFIASVYPMASCAVVALSIQPQHEYEAAFGLGLLSEVDESISFDDKRKAHLAAESLSFSPKTSVVSQQGRQTAVNFRDRDPSMLTVLDRINVGIFILAAPSEAYLARSCRFRIGSLSEK